MNLLIVDDETRTREMLKNHFDWEKFGFIHVETARNGMDALVKCNTTLPDVILCDIRMPKMDGLAFAERLRQTGFNSKIIFISGYSDKESLMSAIHLQAFKFIEKPLQPEQIEQTVAEAVASLAKEREEKLLSQESMDEYVVILRSEMVKKLISNPDSPHVLPALKSQDTFLIAPTGVYTVMVGLLIWSVIEQDEWMKRKQQRLLQSLNAHAFVREGKILCGYDSEQRLVFIVPEQLGGTYREGRDNMEQCHYEIRSIAGDEADIKLGIGDTVQHLKDIPLSYHSALQACGELFYARTKSMLFASEIVLAGAVETETLKDDRRAFRELLSKGKLDEARTEFIHFSNNVKQSRYPHILHVKESYFKLLLDIMEIASQHGLNERVIHEETHSIWRKLSLFVTIEQLEQFTLSFLDALSDNKNGTIPLKMREITRFIHSQFHQQGFNIQAIADHVHLSETYLCAYFKKQTGFTVKEYINKVRTEKAIELLLKHDMKHYEIASEIGFTDANYFTTFFKRMTGFTPSEYRERVPK